MGFEHAYPSTYEGVVQLMRDLRGPNGCPWDREQTHDSVKGALIEECYELIEAIESGEAAKMAEELGDVLLQVVFHLQIGAEAGTVSQDQVLGSLIDKLVRRHPHVFGDTKAEGARQVQVRWNAIKRSERTGGEQSILDGVPGQMPALGYAQAVQRRAGGVGFDWDDFRGVLDKVAEELGEIEQAESDQQREMEMGDLLFSIVNASRWMGVDAEGALRHANRRFYQRFAAMESLSRQRGLSFADRSLDDKEALWQEAKALEPSSSSEAE